MYFITPVVVWFALIISTLAIVQQAWRGRNYLVGTWISITAWAVAAQVLFGVAWWQAASIVILLDILCAFVIPAIVRHQRGGDA